MGVFSGGYGEIGQAQMKSAERCHPDFEAIIKRLRALKAKAEPLLQAIENYVESNGRGSTSFTLESLIGSLYLEIKDCDRGIDQAIKEQESLAKKGEL